MAQTGFTPIQLYSTSTAAAAPVAGNLTNSTLGSELAINITDGKLFYKDNANAVQVIGWKTVPTTAGGTGLTTYTAGDLSYYASGTTFTKLAIGTNGQILTSTGSAPQWSTLSGVAVTTFSAGTTGFTPNSATSGAITLAGTLTVGNGGTGTATAFTAGSVVFAGASGVYSQDNTNFFWDNTAKELGIRTASPLSALHVNADGVGLVAGLSLTNNNGATAGNGAAINFGANSVATAQTGQIASALLVNGGQHAYMTFSTRASNVLAERMRIHFTGGVSIGNTTDPGANNLSVTGTGQFGTTVGVGNATPATSGAGITFPATASASSNANTLDDYEEGTWTPTWTGLTTSGSVNVNIGYYVKVGRIVYYAAFLQYTTSFTTTQGTTYHTLPFNANVSSANLAANVSTAANIGDVGLTFSGASVSYVPGVAAGITEVVFTGTYYST
jgi:hypothetical protein